MNAIQQLLTDHIDIWTAAEAEKKSGRGRSGGNGGNGTSVYGVKKLRELTLELAVCGKLVPQDPNDEPASELLKHIQAEKAKLIAEGKIKKGKPLPPITEEEKLFELPLIWEWVRLGEVTNYGIADKAEPGGVDEETWVLELEDVEKKTSRLLQKIRYSERQFRSSKNQFRKDDVIYGKLRPYLDKVIVAEEDGVCTTEMMPVRGYIKTSPCYLRLVMKSPYFIKYANDSTHGMNLPRLGTDKARLALFPIAPYNEQRRIVAKVDELMSLCDQLETQHINAAKAHEKLVSHLLGMLTQVQSAEEFSANWQRIAAHFDTLFTTEASIDALKQTLLQLAVMGKLASQDPNDEPASELLKRIQTEKAKLIAEGKIKKGKTLPPISDEEKPFELPLGWEWVRFEELIPEFQNGISSRGDSDGEPLVVLRLADIKESRILLNEPRKLLISPKMIEKYRLLMGDILVIRVNGSADLVGGFVVCEQIFDGIYCDHFIRMRISQNILNPTFLALLGASHLVRNQIKNLFVTTAGQKTVNQSHIGSLIIPLLSVSAQHRIVAKVDELVTLCDQLKARISESGQLQQKLADVAVERAIL